ncbi:MAG TPA: penicillin acylase family protein [Bryobacteraceae bacterium]|nr:penicillin acylase family protein [Bryobacterales bacterium]HRJ20837.1 penicillin acylase family protein [Bryobacteraceae bacterium]
MSIRATVLLLAALSAPAAEIAVPGLREPAEILVDRWGVPHIYARNFHDAFFTQGLNAARDRLFQIDLWRRRGLGQLAEVLGPSYLDQDKAARLFLYRGDMDAEWAAYGPQARQMAEAFAAGVNAWIAHIAARPELLPIEFRVLGYQPAPWDPADIVRIRSHGLTGNLNAEVARARVFCQSGLENGPKHDHFRSGLQPPWQIQIPDGLDPCLPPDVLGQYTLATQAVRFLAPPVTSDLEGSNNWTIAPAKSATGRPILASDPHRAYSTPSLRYIAHISAPGLDLIGGGEPSLPGISIGHNGAIAFGLTRFYIDQEDLYFYEINPQNPLQYRYRDAWEDMRVHRETFNVKGAPPVHADLAFTRHGPVIWTNARRAFAVRSSWFEPGTAAYFGSAAYSAARNFNDFRSGLARALVPGLNYVYADTQGNIGWAAAGLAPIRPNWDGLLPVPGDGRYEWAGFWTASQLPSSANPPSGYLATANEMNLPPDYPHAERKLGFEWVNSSRFTRIDSVLKNTPKVTLEDSMRLQNDITSIPARRLAALLAPLKSDDPGTRAALALFRGWDGVEHAHSATAALYEVWISRHLGRAFLAAVLPATSAVRSPDMAVLIDTLEKGTLPGRDTLLLESLAAAFRETGRLLGPDPKNWQWGNLHHSFPAHPLLDSVDEPLRSQLQVGPFPKSGGPHSPNQSGYRATDFRQSGGASFRLVVDVGNWDNSRAVNYPGQSGDPASPHYRDLVELWREGRYFPLLYTRPAVEKATLERFILVPAPK